MIDGGLGEVEPESADDIADTADGLSGLAGDGFFGGEDSGDTFIDSSCAQIAADDFSQGTAESFADIRNADLGDIPSAACAHGT